MTYIDCTASTSELAELETLLASGRARLGFFNLSSLDGFLAAILVGPVWMSPKAWLPLTWNGSEPEWRDPDEASRVRTTILNRHDEVARQLAEEPGSYTPILRTLPDGTVLADDWSRGFQAGIGLHPREWDALDRDPRAKHFLVTIVAQLPDRDERIMAVLGQEAVLAFRCKGRDFIGYCVAEIGRFWARRRQASDRRRNAARQPMLNECLHGDVSGDRRRVDGSCVAVPTALPWRRNGHGLARTRAAAGRGRPREPAEIKALGGTGAATRLTRRGQPGTRAASGPRYGRGGTDTGEYRRTAILCRAPTSVPAE